MNKEECVLGIDPGIGRVGVAVVIKKERKEVLLFSNCLESDKKLPDTERLFWIGQEVEKVIKKYKPKAIALEKLFFGKNSSTAMRVSECRGIIIFLAKKYGCPVLELHPAEVKISVGVGGRGSKNEVIKMLSIILDVAKGKRILDDEYDAMAIAIAGLLKIKHISLSTL